MKKLFLVSTTWLLCTLFGYGQSIESRYTYWLIHRIVLFHRGMNCLLIQETSFIPRNGSLIKAI